MSSAFMVCMDIVTSGTGRLECVCCMFVLQVCFRKLLFRLTCNFANRAIQEVA